jgi:hypothetical protein
MKEGEVVRVRRWGELGAKYETVIRSRDVRSNGPTLGISKHGHVRTHIDVLQVGSAECGLGTSKYI